MDERAFLLESWRSEAFELFRAGRSAIERTDRVLPVIGTVLVAGTIASIANGFPEALLAVPVVLALALAYAINSLSDSLVMGLARLRLEQALRSELGRDALLYESYVAPLRRAEDNKSTRINVFIAAAALVGSSVAGLLQALTLGALPTVVYCASVAVSSLAVIAGSRDLARLWGRSRAHYAEAPLLEVPDRVDP